MRQPHTAFIIFSCFFAVFILYSAVSAHAENLPASASLYGPLGLNTVPSARMDEPGTIRAGLSTLDPYAHTWLSLQLSAPLSVTLRQSAEISSLTEAAKRLYPGTDLKLRLLKETRARPEIAIGLQSAIGHKRMAGEYLAASKRYQNFDFTAGLGWGRMGSAGHFKNPLKALHPHFGKNRPPDSENPNKPEDWFTGEKIGLFGGVEYFAPFIDGLSLKLDYGADRFTAERAVFDYHAPAPWAIGLNYRPAPWIDLALAAQGTDKLMARLSLQSNIKDWRDFAKNVPESPIFRPYRTGLALPSEMQTAAQKEGQILYAVQAGTHNAQAALELQSKDGSTPKQIGNAATHMANHAGPDIETLILTPTVMGLKGPKIEILRGDLERARAKNNGSAEEIWSHARFTPEDTATILPEIPQPKRKGYDLRAPEISLDNQVSLSEEDGGTLYRTSLSALWKGRPRFFGLIDIGTALRLNIKDNLSRIAEIRPKAILPVRSNEDRFAARTLALDKQYLAFTHTPRPDTHLSLIAGYLEEMYAGAGGEILYRPFGKRWTVGAESWLALKRDPETALNLGLNGDHVLTGHLKAWYDIPGLDVTLEAKAGHYLAADTGLSLSLQKRFQNGAQIEAFATITNTADLDLFGGTTHAYNGLRLSLPLGGFKYAPPDSRLTATAAPFGRDAGQTLQNPLPLYTLTEAFSKRHLSEHWSDMAE